MIPQPLLPQVEGIFSGTLSYIFNSFNSGSAFSQIVAEARAAGYTEPDPRDDLAGMDVARKVTILARHAPFCLLLEPCLRSTMHQLICEHHVCHPWYECS